MGRRCARAAGACKARGFQNAAMNCKPLLPLTGFSPEISNHSISAISGESCRVRPKDGELGADTSQMTRLNPGAIAVGPLDGGGGDQCFLFLTLSACLVCRPLTSICGMQMMCKSSVEADEAG